LAKRPIPPIVEDQFRLRLLEENDLPMTLAWRNQDHIRRWFLHSDIITPERHRAWWEHYRDRDDDFVFVIEETRQLNRPVGQASLYNIDWPGGRAEFGRLMIGDAAASGLGLARQSTARLIDEALGPWQLREIRLEVLETNVAARRVYEACGFSQSTINDGVVVMTKSNAIR
jgi:RimJ/RimL family protein N-acetyltransferase